MRSFWTIEPRPFVAPVAPDDPYDYLNDPSISDANKRRLRIGEISDQCVAQEHVDGPLVLNFTLDIDHLDGPSWPRP